MLRSQPRKRTAFRASSSDSPGSRRSPSLGPHLIPSQAQLTRNTPAEGGCCPPDTAPSGVRTRVACGYSNDARQQALGAVGVRAEPVSEPAPLYPGRGPGRPRGDAEAAAAAPTRPGRLPRPGVSVFPGQACMRRCDKGPEILQDTLATSLRGNRN